MSLKDWLKSGWVVEHKSSPREIADLFKAADRDLSDCRASGLSSDWKLNIAYSAALHMATAALAAAGFRSARDSHHYRTIQSLSFTIGADTVLISQFDQFRKKRNIGVYEIAGAVSDLEADAMVSLAIKLRKDVEESLRANHPELFRKKRGKNRDS
jgi:hypothetical protein